jgi:hypothetical protein
MGGSGWRSISAAEGAAPPMREETGRYDEFLNLALAASDLIVA